MFFLFSGFLLFGMDGVGCVGFWLEERARSGPLSDAVALLRAHAEQHGLA